MPEGRKIRSVATIFSTYPASPALNAPNTVNREPPAKQNAGVTNETTTRVTDISAHGIRLSTGNGELFLSYQHFPWFKSQTVQAIVNVEEPTPGHFHWPDLDIDLTADIIAHPEKFPLIANRD